ncbi:MAG: hypothetical protein LH610_09850, partial [Sphingomonas bacterium]|nr:hypothetical protein [Sphingomonas bacterium]
MISNVENVAGSAFDDFVSGTMADNRIDGGAGNDRLFGGGGADVLSGDAGDDTVSGSEGVDILSGGGGNDRFLYYLGDGNDTITDLAAGDRIIFDGYAAPESITQVGNDVVVRFSPTDQLTCLNTDVATVRGTLPQPAQFVSDPPLPRPSAPTVTYTVIVSGIILSPTTYYRVNIDPTYGPFAINFRPGSGSPHEIGESVHNQ